MSLYTLVYASVSTVPMTEKDLGNLLSVARKEQEELGLTGMLLYRDGMYVQAIEGEESVVKQLFERLRQDPRHANVTKIYAGKIKERHYPDWTMGFRVLTDAEIKNVKGFTDFLDNPSQHHFDNPAYTQALLENFRVGYLFS